MPELPEVETVVRELRLRLRGRIVGGVEEDFPGVYLRSPGIRPAWPRAVSGVGRRGKFIRIDLEGGFCFVVHLRMTGRVEVTAADSPRAPHTHVRIALDGGEELRYADPRRFGRVRLESATTLGSQPYWAGLGPEPLEIDVEELARQVGATRSPIKSALLDQRRLAGIGNIYADEILHAAALHPLQPADTVLGKEWPRVLQGMREILGSAIAHGGSTIRDYVSAGGQPGAFQDSHRVFGRGGEPCPRCAGTIRKIRVSGRGTHYCPGCQPLRRRRKRRSPLRGPIAR